MADPLVDQIPGETAAERRARLRRMRILGNSENRMQRIFGAVSAEPEPEPDTPETSESSDQCLSSPVCDNDDSPKQVPSPKQVSSPKQVPIPKEYPVFSPQLEEDYYELEEMELPSRETEGLPRKVSMISSPIDYKTLQRSQEHAASVNNYLNSFQLNIATPTITLVIILAVVSGFAHLNIPTVVGTFQAITHAVAFQFDFKKGSVVKEITTFLFVYAMIQVLFLMF